MRQSEAQSQLAEEMVATARQLSGSLTELAASIRGNSQNNVLYSGLRRIPSSGVLTLQFTVPMASVGVGTCLISDGEEVTVAAEPPRADPPEEGPGINVLLSSSFQVWPLVGTVLSIWAPATERVWIGVWSAPQPPGMAIGDLSGS